MAIHASLKKIQVRTLIWAARVCWRCVKSSLWLEYGLSLILKNEDWSVLITNLLDEKRIKDKKREHKRNGSESKKGKKECEIVLFSPYSGWKLLVSHTLIMVFKAQTAHACLWHSLSERSDIKRCWPLLRKIKCFFALLCEFAYFRRSF